MVNDLVHTSLPVPAYSAILAIPETGPGPPHIIDSLTHIDCYISDVITVVHGGPDQQREVSNVMVWVLK